MKSTHPALQKLKMYSIIDFAVLLEAVLESAPRFINQLYAISVQEEPAAIIQIISLPISFLTLAWAFTATNKWSLPVCKIIPSSSDLNVKHQNSFVCNSRTSPEQSTVRHLLFHCQQQVVGYWRCNVSFLCGSNGEVFSGLRRFLYYSFYGDLLPKR